MSFCLVAQTVEKFKQAIKDGSLDPIKMSEMTSEDRHALLGKFVDEGTAKEVNALYESKLLLKDQQAGIIRWIGKITDATPKMKADMIDKVNKLQNALNPADQKMFLKDLVDKKLGVDISAEEAKNITELASKLSETRTETKPRGDGIAKVQLEKYINDLKGSAKDLKASDYLKPQNWAKGVGQLFQLTKQLVASLTIHAPFKHGFVSLFEDPVSWGKNYAAQFGEIAKSLKGEDVQSAVLANIYDRPNYQNGLYDNWLGKNQFSGHQEELISTLPSKIPLLGKVFKASQDVFEAFNNQMRADITDHYINIVKKMGEDPNDPEIAKAWGQLAIDQTGGKSEAKSPLNKVLFSERLIKSQFRNLTSPVRALFTSGAERQAALQATKTLVKVIGGMAAVLATSQAIAPGSVEWDPRSSNFGTIKVGNTRFDISGGMKGMVDLAARLVTHSTKSSTSGKITQLDTGKFGSPTSKDQIVNFLEGRLSPVGGTLLNLFNKQTFTGEKPNVKNTLQSLFEPIPAQTYEQLKLGRATTAQSIATLLLQQLGVMSSTYSAATFKQADIPTYLSDSASKEIERLVNTGNSPTLVDPTSDKTWTDLKTKLGQSKYDQATSDFESKYSSGLTQLLSQSQYERSNDAGKKKLLDNLRTYAQKQAQADVKYKPTPVKVNTAANNANNNLLKRLVK